MEIVIKIDENIYTRLFDNGIGVSLNDNIEMSNAIRNGTPLPKGHGRLIDENDLKTLYGLDDRLWWGNAVAEFTDLPTIIEADRGSKNNGINNR